MANPLAVLPIHIALQIISSGNSTNGVVTCDTPSPNQAPVVPNGYDAFPDIGVAYKYFSSEVTYDAARIQCITEGGSLAVIDSSKTMDYAVNTVKKQVIKNGPGPWVGIHRLFNISDWVGAKTDVPLTYVPWRAAEDHHSAISHRCAALWPTEGVGIGSWDCRKLLPFMCEVPISKQPLQMAIDIKFVVTNKPHVNRTVKVRNTIPDGFTPFSDVGVAYKLIKETLNWNSARTRCIALNGTLAVIDSDQKKNYALGVLDRFWHPWVGIHRLSGTSEWVSVKTGLPVPALPWSSTRDLASVPGNCLILRHDNPGLSTWSCDSIAQFICEIPLFIDCVETASNVCEPADDKLVAN